MDRFLDFLLSLIAIIIGIVGAGLLLSQESAAHSFIGLGCFLLVGVFQLGIISGHLSTIAGRMRENNEWLEYLGKLQKPES